MHVLYIATSGAGDPTRASIAMHLAVNGSLEADQTAGVVLAGDAAELLNADVRESLEGVGLPPARELFAKARRHEVPIFV
jgi:predicted peroxiredoxin